MTRERLLKTQLADLIKNVSDNNPHVTLVIVGVAANILELIGGHPSIERNLVQIEMPVMSADEISEIVEKGCYHLHISLDPDVLTELALLADGFPHYAHLLGLAIARACYTTNKLHMDRSTFDQLACSLAIEDAVDTFRRKFASATLTTRVSRYPQILCACAWAEATEHGVFRASSVVEAFSAMFEEEVKMQAVVRALGEFTTPERDSVLSKIKVGKNHHYRFTEPMMRPFLRIKAKTLQE